MNIYILVDSHQVVIGLLGDSDIYMRAHWWAGEPLSKAHDVWREPYGKAHARESELYVNWWEMWGTRHVIAGVVT
jgi:hypothetical protein